MDERTCSQCGNTYPLDRKYFRWRVQDGNGFFTAECLACIAKGKKRSVAKKKQRRESSMRKIEDAGVDMFLTAIQNGGSNIPHSAEVIERVFSYFGGVGGFSAVLVKQYWDSPPGGSARNRLLETLCRLVSKNVEQGGAKKPLTLWSEDELEQELQQRLAQAVTVITGTVVHGEEEKEPRRLTAQEAEQASDIAAAVRAFNSESDAIPAGRDQGVAKRDSGKTAGGPASLQAEPESGEGTRDSGE